MRRLAKNDRNDVYGSNRDYQDIINESTEEYVIKSDDKIELIYDNLGNESEFIGIESYFKSDGSNTLLANVYDSSNSLMATKKGAYENYWKRFGLGWINDKSSQFYKIDLIFSNPNIKVYNLNVSAFNRPIENENDIEDEIKKLNASHLSPEGFYLFKEGPEINGVEEIAEATDFIELKKCSYCQRFMLVGDLDSSFHKHASKKSGYQNECRACKKFRINDTFNPIRTPDQHNESSVITRERKILLREPQILNEIKNRHSGEGLKSLTWKKFNKKCFNCTKPLKLKEVQLDHTRPLAYLWPLDEYATCLCSDCNNSKHDKFPIEFYTSREKREQLSKIIGLDIDILEKREVNEYELNKIIKDIEYYYEKLDLKTFKSIRNKVISIKSEVDLYEILKNQSQQKHQQLLYDLATRNE